MPSRTTPFAYERDPSCMIYETMMLLERTGEPQNPIWTQIWGRPSGRKNETQVTKSTCRSVRNCAGNQGKGMRCTPRIQPYGWSDDNIAGEPRKADLSILLREALVQPMHHAEEACQSSKTKDCLNPDRNSGPKANAKDVDEFPQSRINRLDVPVAIGTFIQVKK